MKVSLSDREMDFLKQYTALGCPSYREMSKATGESVNTIKAYAEAVRKKTGKNLPGSMMMAIRARQINPYLEAASTSLTLQGEINE